MQKLGMVEYRKLMEEVDSMTHQPIDVMALVNKWIEELREHLEAEEKEKQEGERRQTLGKPTKLEPCLLRPQRQLNLLRSPENEHVMSTTSTNLGVEPVPRNQNPQRRPRRKRYRKLLGQRSQSLKLTMLTTNRKIEKRSSPRRNSRVRERKRLDRPRTSRKRLWKMRMMTG